MTFLPTRFLSSRFLTKLGIRDQVMGLLRVMLLENLSRMDHPSYPGLTRQFLATVEVHFPPRRRLASVGSITFKIGNKSYKLDVSQVCKAYGFRDRSLAKFPKFDDATKFWNVIGDGGEFEKARSKASSIRNPVFRLAHRFLTQTIFVRNDISRVKNDELCLLFNGIKGIARGPDGCEFQDPFTSGINIGAIFIWELGQHAKWALETPLEHPSTSIGGVLVPLFIAAGVPLSQHYCDPRRAYIDRASLIATRILRAKKRNGSYVYLFKDAQRRDRKFLLPNPECTDLSYQKNIAFPYGEFLEDNESDLDDEYEEDDESEEDEETEHGEEMGTEQQQQEPQPQPQQQATPHQVPTLEEMFQNIQLRPMPFDIDPENEHERWFAEEHERQRRFNMVTMNLFSEYDRLTGRLNQPSPAISGFSEFDDSNDEGEYQGGPSSSHH